MRRRLVAWRSGVYAVAVLGLGTLAAGTAGAEAYPTPEAARDAFRAAVEKDDGGEALLALFGSESRAELVGGDPAEARLTLQRLRNGVKTALTFSPEGPDRGVLLVGASAWPMPIPLVKAGEGWEFDTAAGIEEMRDRRVGRHELAAIELAREYVEAQVEYADADRDGDQVLEYAQRIGSEPGKQNGLYWADASNDDPSPFGEFVGNAESGYLEERRASEPYYGYHFRVLTRQGATPPGGAYDYVINGNMIAGFGLLAWPAEYGISGVMTFVVNQQGKVYEKDLGADTAKLAESIRSYDLGPGWSEVEASE